MPSSQKTPNLGLNKWQPGDQNMQVADFVRDNVLIDAAFGEHTNNATIHVTQADKDRLNGLSNPNLLINGDFQVCQRGISFSQSAPFFAADRWYVDTYGSLCSSSISDAGLHFEAGAASRGVEQRFEPKKRYGRDFCVSTLVKTNGKKCMLLLTAKNTVSGVTRFVALSSEFANTEYALIQITGSLLDNEVIDRVKLESREEGLTVFDSVYIKIENGSIATPLVPLSPSVNAMECKRTYEELGAGIIITAQSPTNVTFAVPFVEKRIIPTLELITASPVISDIPYSGTFTATNATISSYQCTKNGVLYCNMDGFSGLVAGKQYISLTEKLIAVDADI